jgi:hypothetical protein
MQIEFKTDRPRAAEHTLEWPVTVDGREYTSISLVRMTAADVAKFQEELTARLNKDATATAVFPIFRDSETGEPIPEAVLDALDDDDRFELDKAAVNFLPRRFRGALNLTSDPADGAPIEPSSEV